MTERTYDAAGLHYEDLLPDDKPMTVEALQELVPASPFDPAIEPPWYHSDMGPVRRGSGELVARDDYTQDKAWFTSFVADAAMLLERHNRLIAELAAANAELALRRKSGSASERLHNICEGISKDADGSEWSREEWEKLDADMLALRKERDAANAVIDAACGALHGEGVCDQGEAWDKALNILDAARALRKGMT